MNRVFITAQMYPGSPVDQTKWLVFGMIHVFRIPDPTNGQAVWSLDFLGVSVYIPVTWIRHGKKKQVPLESKHAIWGLVDGVNSSSLYLEHTPECNI